MIVLYEAREGEVGETEVAVQEVVIGGQEMLKTLGDEKIMIGKDVMTEHLGI